MTVKMDVKWKFEVNGTEYGSVEEMPAPVREAYEKAFLNLQHGTVAAATTAGVVFNGREYAAVDAMDTETRRLYESIMKTAHAAGNRPSKGPAAAGIDGAPTGRGTAVHSVSRNVPKPIVPGTGSSLRKRLTGLAVVVLLAAIYFLIRILGSR